MEQIDPTQNLPMPQEATTSFVPVVAQSPTQEACPQLSMLLEMIREFLLRYIVFSFPEQVILMSLWVVHTWVFNIFDFTPYLHLCSATKRSGKSRLLECLQLLVRCPWSIVSATAAVIFRMIECHASTILFDEIDTIYKSSRDKTNEILRAVLNAGFSRGNKVPRCVGDGIIEYSVFSPKAFAGIGDALPDTVKDRCIRIQLARRAQDQNIQRFRSVEAEQYAKSARDELNAWSSHPGTIAALRCARPDIPAELGDRAADISAPLLAIAAMAGGDWPQKARDAILILLNDGEEGDLSILLLSAIREIFELEGRTQLPTQIILQRLAERDDNQIWVTQWGNEVIHGHLRGPASKLSAVLKPFGIVPGTIREPNGSTPEGYKLDSFQDVFKRYLS